MFQFFRSSIRLHWFHLRSEVICDMKIWRSSLAVNFKWLSDGWTAHVQCGSSRKRGQGFWQLKWPKSIGIDYIIWKSVMILDFSVDFYILDVDFNFLFEFSTVRIVKLVFIWFEGWKFWMVELHPGIAIDPNRILIDFIQWYSSSYSNIGYRVVGFYVSSLIDFCESLNFYYTVSYPLFQRFLIVCDPK